MITACETGRWRRIDEETGFDGMFGGRGGGLGRYGHLFFFVVPQRPRDGLPRAVGAGGGGQRLHLFRK